MDVDFQFGLLRGKVRVKKNPPRSGVVSVCEPVSAILNFDSNDNLPDFDP